MSLTCPPPPPPTPSDEHLWALKKGARSALCVLRQHPLGVEVPVDIDGEPYFTNLHRVEADAVLNAAELEDGLLGRGSQQAPETSPGA